MALPHRSTPAGMTGLFRRLSAFVDDPTRLGGLQLADAQEIVEGLQAELQRAGAIECTIEASGALEVNGTLIAAGEACTFGRILAQAGVRSLIMTPELEAPHVLTFLQTVGGFGSSGPAPESDLVTYWHEEGESTIRFVETVLHAQYLKSGGVATLAEAERLAASLTSRAELSSAAAAPPQPVYQPPALGRSEHKAIELLTSRVAGEDESSLRRQYVTALLTVLGVSQLALSPRELTALLLRVLGDLMRSGEWDDVLKTLRNLELMSHPDARVPSHTKQTAKTVLQGLLGAPLMTRVIRACIEPALPLPPHRLLRWLLTDNPAVVWKALGAQLANAELPTLVRVFSTCLAAEHPFWKEAVAMLRPDQQAVVRTSIATMETVWQKPATANNVAVPAPAFSKPEVTEQWLADLELADGEDEYPNELDASLIAFLDPSREKAANPSKPGLPSSMLNHLEELERSLARGIRKAKDPS